MRLRDANTAWHICHAWPGGTLALSVPLSGTASRSTPCFREPRARHDMCATDDPPPRIQWPRRPIQTPSPGRALRIPDVDRPLLDVIRHFLAQVQSVLRRTRPERVNVQPFTRRIGGPPPLHREPGAWESSARLHRSAFQRRQELNEKKGKQRAHGDCPDSRSRRILFCVPVRSELLTPPATAPAVMCFEVLHVRRFNPPADL